MDNHTPRPSLAVLQRAVQQFVAAVQDEARQETRRRRLASQRSADGAWRRLAVTDLAAAWSPQDIARWLGGLE